MPKNSLKMEFVAAVDLTELFMAGVTFWGMTIGLVMDFQQFNVPFP